MKFDDMGDVGFLEAMVAVLVVAAALMIYIPASGMMLSHSEDPMRGFDGDMLEYDPDEGALTDASLSYIEGFLGGVRGIIITVEVIGQEEAEFSFGDTSGDWSHRRYIGVSESDTGRKPATVFGVTVCARTTGGSWRWSMPWCSSGYSWRRWR